MSDIENRQEHSGTSVMYLHMISFSCNTPSRLRCPQQKKIPQKNSSWEWENNLHRYSKPIPFLNASTNQIPRITNCKAIYETPEIFQLSNFWSAHLRFVHLNQPLPHPRKHQGCPTPEHVIGTNDSEQQYVGSEL